MVVVFGTNRKRYEISTRLIEKLFQVKAAFFT